MIRKTMFVAAVLCGGVALAQAKDAFLRQQAVAEMQRVSGQVDVLQANFNDLQSRVGKLEGGGDVRGLRQEIDSLKAQVADLRREMQSQREAIVKDLTARISKMQQLTAAQERKAAQPTKPAYTGPCQEYVVKSGDTLFVIAMAFDTSVDKIRNMNNLKNDNLRIGQKLLVPKAKE